MAHGTWHVACNVVAELPSSLSAACSLCHPGSGPNLKASVLPSTGCTCRWALCPHSLLRGRERVDSLPPRQGPCMGLD